MNNVRVIVEDCTPDYNIVTQTVDPSCDITVNQTGCSECDIIYHTEDLSCTVVTDPEDSVNCVVPDRVVPSNHAITHRYNGSDPLIIGDILPLPGNPFVFLNGTGGFSAISGVGTNLSASYSSNVIEILNSNGSGVTLSGANQTYAGLLTAENQTIAGNKTFSGTIISSIINYIPQAVPPIYQAGNTYYDDNEDTLVVQTDIADAPTILGKMLWERVVNKTTGILTKGTIVYVSGAQGSRQKAWPAIANKESTSSTTFGVIQSDIAINAEGKVVTFGHVEGLDFSTYNDGDILYLSPTISGGYTKVKPIAPNHIVKVGQVVRNQNNGSMSVSIQNGFEIDELHDVLITDKKDGQTIEYDGLNKLWKNKIPDKNPSFTYFNGDLSRIDYSNGNYKLFTYSSGLLTELNYITPGRTINKLFSYNIDGNLTSISQTEIYN